jgi:hypothetical protein
LCQPRIRLTLPICAFYLLAASENRALPLRPIPRSLLALLTPWLLLVAAVTAWRLAYYGVWLPNTITAKSMPSSAFDSITLAKTVAHGLLYWFAFLASALPLTLSTGLTLLVERQRSGVWLCVAIVLLQVPVVLANGGDWMPYYRLLAPYAPLLAVPLGLALNRVATVSHPPGSLPPG